MSERHRHYQLSTQPKARKEYKYEIKSLGVLDKRDSYDSGNAVEMHNIDTQGYPMLRCAKAGAQIGARFAGTILDLTVCDGKIYILRHESESLFIDEVDPASGSSNTITVSSESLDTSVDYSLVRYNEFGSQTDPIGGQYTKKMLILPDYITGDIDGSGGYTFCRTEQVPSAQVGTVFMSRVFCAENGKVFASNFNDVCTYEFDTADESLGSNAWMSNTQSNTKADGDITALAVYDGHVVLFKRDYMMQVYNNKNPFRLVEVGSYGCISRQAICEFDGKLAFVSPQGVMLYSGGYPYFIGKELCIDDWEGTLLCASGELLYMYVPSRSTVYVYDAEHECWGNTNSGGNISFMCGDFSGAYYMLGHYLYCFGKGGQSAFSIKTAKSSLGYEGRKRICALSGEVIVGEQSEVTVSLCDENGETHQIKHINSPGAYFINQRICGIAVQYACISLNGLGDVSMGDFSLTYKKEDE